MLSTTSILTLAYAVASASANCLHGTSFLRREEGAVKVSKFSYTGETGPLMWAELNSTANEACRSGKNQSPIVIDDSVQKASTAPTMKIDEVEEAEFENLGSTLEVIANGTLELEGKEYGLKQFHFHTPSEHRIHEEYYPLEMHMVHQAEDKSLAVVAVSFDLSEDGSTTELLTSVTQNMNDVQEPGTSTKTGPLKFEEVVNAVSSSPIFQYTGSLTTPPCAEGVTFLVLEQPMNLDVKTYNAMKKIMKFNARYTQNTLGKENLLALTGGNATTTCATEGADASGAPTSSSAQSEASASASSASERRRNWHFKADLV